MVKKGEGGRKGSLFCRRRKKKREAIILFPYWGKEPYVGKRKTGCREGQPHTGGRGEARKPPPSDR